MPRTVAWGQTSEEPAAPENDRRDGAVVPMGFQLPLAGQGFGPPILKPGASLLPLRGGFCGVRGLQDPFRLLKGSVQVRDPPGEIANLER